MPRIALGIEYDGTEFVGWQQQRTGRTVQSVLTEAVSRVADEPVTLHVAGRTDSGVHASGQVVHFDTGALRAPRQWVLGVNANSPADVAVRWAREVPPDFDARRSALARTYRYEILVQPERPALDRRRVWWLRGPFDTAAVSAAATYLLGERDFSAFRGAGCQSRSPWRRLTAVAVRGRGRGERIAVTLEFTANAFLLHMVRNLVGFLAAVGRGEAAPAATAEVLAGRDRRQAGVTAPPQGLTLVRVAYPERFALPD